MKYLLKQETMYENEKAREETFTDFDLACHRFNEWTNTIYDEETINWHLYEYGFFLAWRVRLSII